MQRHCVVYCLSIWLFRRLWLAVDYPPRVRKMPGVVIDRFGILQLH